jgi:predicted nucleic acid-binding protein
MAHRSTVYLDTSAINFLFADDSPEKQAITADFFENFIRPGIYETWVSDYVLQEINQTPAEVQRHRLLDVIDEYPIDVLVIESEEEVDLLADSYLRAGVIPPKKLLDALHVATCTVHRIDYLVSWNYKHLANVNREQKSWRSIFSRTTAIRSAFSPQLT